MYSKDFFASKTTWGAVMILVGPALRAMGIQVDEQGLVDAASTLVGMVIFIWGQFTRKSEIGSIAGIEVKK